MNQNAPSCTKYLLRNCPANKDKSKKIIFNETLLQNYSAYMEKISSTEEDKPEYTITQKKVEGNEVTYDAPNFNVSKIFEYRRNNPDVSYEREYVSTSVNEYFTYILDHLK